MDQVTREAIRYLGYGRNAADDQTLKLIKDSFESLRSVVGSKSVCRIFDLQWKDDGTVIIGTTEVISRSLARNLRGCDKIVLFGATLGIGVDRLIARISLTDMAKAVVLQACAAALLEEYCDQCQEKIAEEMRTEGRYLRPRFSPGYGDFSIAYQKDVMQMLDCAKTIGITITDGFMMSPSKSVTAMIGAALTDEKCHIQGCECCEKTDCQYRRDIL